MKLVLAKLIFKAVNEGGMYRKNRKFFSSPSSSACLYPAILVIDCVGEIIAFEDHAATASYQNSDKTLIPKENMGALNPQYKNFSANPT